MATVRFVLVGVCYISEEHARLSGPPHHRDTLEKERFLVFCACVRYSMCRSIHILFSYCINTRTWCLLHVYVWNARSNADSFRSHLGLNPHCQLVLNHIWLRENCKWLPKSQLYSQPQHVTIPKQGLHYVCKIQQRSETPAARVLISYVL